MDVTEIGCENGIMAVTNFGFFIYMLRFKINWIINTQLEIQSLEKFIEITFKSVV